MIFDRLIHKIKEVNQAIQDLTNLLNKASSNIEKINSQLEEQQDEQAKALAKSDKSIFVREFQAKWNKEINEKSTQAYIKTDENSYSFTIRSENQVLPGERHVSKRWMALKPFRQDGKTQWVYVASADDISELGLALAYLIVEQNGAEHNIEIESITIN